MTSMFLVKKIDLPPGGIDKHLEAVHKYLNEVSVTNEILEWQMLASATGQGFIFVIEVERKVEVEQDVFTHVMAEVVKSFAEHEDSLMMVMRRKVLAAKMHEIWSDWMIYLFSKCRYRDPDGVAIIPEGLVERWKRQMKTPFDKLPSEEQSTDLHVVDKYFTVKEE